MSVNKKRLAMQAAFFLVALTFRATAQTDLAEESHRAKELMADHRFAEAIPIYERLVKAMPGNDGLLLNLALAEEMAGRFAQAVPHFEAVLKSQPDNLPALISLGMARLQLNQNREAIAPLRKAIAQDPDNENVLGMLAGAELNQQQYEQAATHYAAISKRNESDPRAWYGLGKAWEALAARSFDRLNKTAPDSAYVAILLADTRVQRHQYRSAFFFYQEAQRRLPDVRGVHAGLAQVYRDTEHADWAEQEIKKEASLAAPDCASKAFECAYLDKRYSEAAKTATAKATPEALYWATKAYNALAVQAFDRLGQLPESVQIHAIKAQILSDHKQSLEAANEWRAAIKLAPDDPALKRELAAALFAAKDYQGTIPLAEEQLVSDPKSQELNYFLGASLFRTEQPEKALPYLKNAVDGTSTVLPAEAALGLTLVALGQNAEAVPHLKKALDLDDDGSLHYSLARAYRATGETQPATEAMQQYQKIQRQNQEINDQLAKEAEIKAPSQ